MVAPPHSPDSLALARKILGGSDWDQEEVAYDYATRLKDCLMDLANVVIDISKLRQ